MFSDQNINENINSRMEVGSELSPPTSHHLSSHHLISNHLFTHHVMHLNVHDPVASKQRSIALSQRGNMVEAPVDPCFRLKGFAAASSTVGTSVDRGLVQTYSLGLDRGLVQISRNSKSLAKKIATLQKTQFLR